MARAKAGSVLVTVFALAWGISACSGSSGPDQGVASTKADDYSLATVYESVTALTTDSTLIVSGTAKREIVVTVGEVPFTITEFELAEVVKAKDSKRAGATIMIRQSGSSPLSVGE